MSFLGCRNVFRVLPLSHHFCFWTKWCHTLSIMGYYFYSTMHPLLHQDYPSNGKQSQQSGPSPAGGQWCPAPYLKSLASRLLHTSNILLKIYPQFVVFGTPSCEILTTGLTTIPNTVAYSKTHVMICPHYCWWRNPWCHSYVTPVTAQRLAA